MPLALLSLLAVVSPASALSFWGPDTLLADAMVGCRVGAAGDVNGDGYADLLVTDCATDTVRVYTGGAAGISTTYTTLTGEGGGAFGFSLSGGGDLNDDGYSDVVIGAPEAHATRGCVYVAYGSASGLSNPTTPLRCGALAGQTIGGNVDIVGDINGDGYDDMAWSPQSGSTGRLGIHHGGPAGVSATPNRTIALYGYTDEGGEGLRGAGDVNGDGFDDVVVGGPHVDGDTGSIRVYYGAVLGLTGGNVDQFDLYDFMDMEWPYWFDWSVDGAGDVDDDGYDDLLIGNIGYEGNGWVLRGGAGGPTWAPSEITMLYIQNADYYLTLGYSVAGGGDYDADGIPDLAVGQEGYGYCTQTTWAWSGGSDLGSDWVSDTGGSNGDLADWGSDGWSWSGQSVASLGDVDGDGCDDLATGFGLPPGWDAYYDPATMTWGVNVYYGGACPHADTADEAEVVR